MSKKSTSGRSERPSRPKETPDDGGKIRIPLSDQPKPSKRSGVDFELKPPPPPTKKDE